MAKYEYAELVLTFPEDTSPKWILHRLVVEKNGTSGTHIGWWEEGEKDNAITFSEDYAAKSGIELAVTQLRKITK